MKTYILDSPGSWRPMRVEAYDPVDAVFEARRQGWYAYEDKVELIEVKEVETIETIVKTTTVALAPGYEVYPVG